MSLPQPDDCKNQVSMACKSHNHSLQTMSQHHEKETYNTDSHRTAGTQLTYSNHVPLPQKDDCKKQVSMTLKCPHSEGMVRSFLVLKGPYFFQII